MVKLSATPECWNKTITNCTDYDNLHRVLLAGNCAIFAVGMGLNVTALVIFARFFKMTNNTVVYMVNLATCDLLFALALPLRIYYYAAHHWPLGDVPCQLAGSLFQINLYGSCLFLACINVDRLLALVYPLRARHLRRPKVARWACAAVWLVILLGSVPVALAHDTSCCRERSSGRLEVRCFESFSQGTWERELKPLVLMQFALSFVPPLGVVLYCSGRVLYELCQLHSTEAAGKRRKAIRLLVVNATIFVACFLPYNVILVVYTFLKTGGNELVVEQSQARLALQVSMLLTSANCCLDPLVYYFSTEGFRNTFRAHRSPPSPKTSQRWISARSRAGKSTKARRAAPPAGREGEADTLRQGPEGAEGVGNGAPGEAALVAMPGYETPV
ncbi:lysophosphatidic acid receptor 5-like [Mustelus asterias]